MSAHFCSVCQLYGSICRPVAGCVCRAVVGERLSPTTYILVHQSANKSVDKRCSLAIKPNFIHRHVRNITTERPAVISDCQTVSRKDKPAGNYPIFPCKYISCPISFIFINISFRLVQFSIIFNNSF
jgi:hypothetical protein